MEKILKALKNKYPERKNRERRREGKKTQYLQWPTKRSREIESQLLRRDMRVGYGDNLDAKGLKMVQVDQVLPAHHPYSDDAILHGVVTFHGSRSSREFRVFSQTPGTHSQSHCPLSKWNPNRRTGKNAGAMDVNHGPRIRLESGP